MRHGKYGIVIHSNTKIKFICNDRSRLRRRFALKDAQKKGLPVGKGKNGKLLIFLVPEVGIEPTRDGSPAGF